MQCGAMLVIWIGCREVNLSSVDDERKPSPESQPLPLNRNCNIWSLFPSQSSLLFSEQPCSAEAQMDGSDLQQELF